MLSFRQKIFITYVILFILFTSLTFPIVNYIVHTIAVKTMDDRASELIAKIQSASNNDALVRRLKDQKPLIFFRVSLITNEGKVLYDSHTKHLIGPRFSQEYVVDHPEVLEAFEKGTGYTEDYSELLEQKFSYFAKSFDFHGKPYVIRIAFPYKYFADLINDSEIAFLAFTVALLLLFSALTWFIINHLTAPIQKIIRAVTPYQEGKQTTIPEIRLTSDAKGEFGKLAMTLNSLSTKIQKHIDSLTTEKNEKAAILESLVEGVVAVDKEMKVTYANSMALQLLGRKDSELLGEDFSKAQQPQSYAILHACQKEKKPLTDTLTLVKDQENIYLDIVAAPIEDGNGAILVMEDKSSHYKLLEMRKDFIANASHELKTPITIIRGFAEMLHDNPSLPQSTTEEITQKIVNNCQRMNALIKDLLTLSDVENIPLSRLTDCDLYEIAEHCCKMLYDLYPDAQVQLLKTPPGEEIRLVADPSLIELAFMNLIENAAKYSNPPAKISISMEKTKDGIKIVIADQGIGVPKKDLEHIFERFYTVDKAHSQKLGGSGLGLSIVQTIVHKHFGRISVESEVGKGTTVTIFFYNKLS